MSILMNCVGIKKDFGEQKVLKDINFEIKLGDRIGLVGNNGAGKTTLANIIYGNIKQDEGNIMWSYKEVKIGYLLQSTFYRAKTINDMYANDKECITSFLQATSQLGMDKVKDWNQEKFGELSGGEKTKLALANIWTAKPNLLILDEPTNHLDFQGICWLIDEIKKYDGTIIIISHDRYFLDETVGRILEIEDGVTTSYKGNYTCYRDEKKRRYQSQLKAYINQEKYIKKIEKDIDRLKTWSDKSHRGASKKAEKAGRKFGGKEFYRVKAKKKDKQVKSKLKRLEKIELEGIKKPKEEKEIDFVFNNAEKKGKRVIEALNITKVYGDKVLFRDSCFYIQRGDKIGLYGANGCGKTTLIKAIIGEKKLDEGHMFLSSSAKISYISQDVLDLDGDSLVIELFDITSREKSSKVKTLLANLGFTESMIKKQVKNLSLGERTRVKVAQLILNNNSILILDEPTNHLDLNCREKLEEALENYNGTIIIVSHDRYMLERICDKLLVFENEEVKRIECSFKEYIEKTKKENNDKDKVDENLIVETRMAYILGELSKYTPEDPEYQKLDSEFNDLVEKKKRIGGAQ
ncbi:ribosomal protection-like ABC-F family protein [Abyssisolibacter fermentans]|uniref:ribosomal protection-like ABC-F family protein n=1 Tax=Abyssisolibacter fermentans TaxID=1766203 RepID=UPI00082BDFBC|nr:ABC-F type ribosomal protection protein [Abyssisolibacter fermentans]